MVARIRKKGGRQVPEGQPLKKSWEELLDKKLKQSIDNMISQLDRSNIPQFERSGNQRYVFMDSKKDPYVDFFSANTPGVKTEIKTDGKYKIINRYRAAGNEEMEYYEISDYNYILKIHKTKDRIKQIICTKDVGVKMYIQHKLGMALG
jgi:hypothetical protein